MLATAIEGAVPPRAVDLARSVSGRRRGRRVLPCWGIAELVWSVRWELPRYMVAQGLFFIELGLGFVVQAAMPDGIVRTALAMTLYSGAIWTAFVQYKMTRAARRGEQGS